MAQPSSSAPGAGDDAGQGAPAQAQGQPPQGQPAQQGQDQQGGGPISQLLDQVGGALQHLDQVFSASKSIDPKEQQMMSQIVQAYGQLMGSLSGQGGQEPDGDEGQAQGQTAPMEAAGNKGAQPVM